MGTVTLQKATETLKNLNADLGTKASNVVPSNSGTYALINDMISNLSSIKATIKAEEKKIEVDLYGHMQALGAVGTAVGNANAVVNPAADTMTPANAKCTVGVGAAVGNGERHQHANTTTNHLPAVLTANSVSYSEQAVFSILALSAEIIDMLKEGAIPAATVITSNSADAITYTTLTA